MEITLKLTGPVADALAVIAEHGQFTHKDLSLGERIATTVFVGLAQVFSNDIVGGLEQLTGESLERFARATQGVAKQLNESSNTDIGITVACDE